MVSLPFSRADKNAAPRVEDDLRERVLDEVTRLTGRYPDGSLRAYEFLRGVRFAVGVLKEKRECT